MVLIVSEAVDWKVEWAITQSEARASVSGRLYSHDLWLTEGNKKPGEHVYHVNTILLSDGLWQIEMAALRSQQADCFLEFLQPSCTSCKQELFRSVALHCQVLWVTQNLINKTILQRQRKLVSNYLGSWRRYGNHCWKKSNNRYIVFASIFICFELGNREKASETTSSVTRSLDTGHFPTVRTQPWAPAVMT